MKNSAVRKQIEFIPWTLGQHRREDAVGQFAKHVTRNRAWRTASFVDVFAKLTQSLSVEQLQGLQSAYAEYRKALATT